MTRPQALSEIRKLTAASLLAPALIITSLFLIAPLLVLFWVSLHDGYPVAQETSLGIASYVKTLTDPYYLDILLTTITMALGITGLALFFALPLSHFLARTQSRFKSLFLLAIILPLFVGNAVRAIGWMLALGERGVFNTLVEDLGLGGPYRVMYSGTAVLIGAAAVNLPYLVLTLQSVIERLNPSVEEASISLGATPFQTWRLVTLPLIAPGLLAACSLSFILSMNAYATPVLLGGPRFRMMGPTVADEIIVKNNWSVGAVLAFMLISVTLILTVLLNRALSRGITGSPGNAERADDEDKGTKESLT
jgi:putative spermidine/putrescine transport system permease protein